MARDDSEDIISAELDDDLIAPLAKAAGDSGWVGKPSHGGMGGSVATSEDAAYDPMVKPKPFAEVGASGLAQYGGFVREEFLTQLQGARGSATFREMMDNDAIVGALIFAVQMLVRKVEWRIEPAEAASVEDILAQREKENQVKLQEQKVAQQSRLMAAQSGMAGAGGKPGGGGGNGAGFKPPGQMQAPDFARPANSPGSHQPIDSGGSPATKPGDNAPATPNAAGSNPSGGVAQNAALNGQDGLPGAGSKRPDPFSKEAWQAVIDATVGSVLKAGSSGGGGGGQVGGFESQDPSYAPVDPETLEAYPQDDDDTSAQQHKAAEMAVFVETCLHDMATPWADFISQIITFIVFGFAYHELVYKKRNGPNPDDPRQGSRFSDGKIGWCDIAGRAQETVHRWEFDDHGHVIGMWQLAPPKYQLRYIPLSKALLFRTTAYKDNPQGRSILRSAYRSWFFLRRIQEFEAIGVERDNGGLPVAYVPAEMMSDSATAQQRASLEEIKKIVRNIRVNEQAGVVFPMVYDMDGNQMYKLEMLGSSGSGSRSRVDTDKIIARYEQRIAMTALADFILLGHESTGARSLGETKADLFTTALEAFLAAIADTFNTYAIPRLLQLNGEDPAMAPRLVFGKLQHVSLTEIAALITAMAGAGADLFPDTELEDFMREAGGLPAKAASNDL